MREIKFRAWDNIAGRFKTGTELAETIIRVELDGAIELKGAIYNISEVTLMQYTGLKDKNGVEIYEGDIITVTTNHVADLDPKYPEKTTTVEVRCENAVWWFGDMTMIYTPLKNAKLEVIGNIYENPELLEKTND